MIGHGMGTPTPISVIGGPHGTNFARLIAAPPATDIELTTVVAFAAGVLLWVRGAKLTESATLILGLAGGGLVGARLASVGGFEGLGTLMCCILAAGAGVLLARAGVKAIVAVGTGVVMAALLATALSEGLFDQFANAADEAMAPAREVAREASEQAENLGAFTTADDELELQLSIRTGGKKFPANVAPSP